MHVRFCTYSQVYQRREDSTLHWLAQAVAVCAGRQRKLAASYVSCGRSCAAPPGVCVALVGLLSRARAQDAHGAAGGRRNSRSECDRHASHAAWDTEPEWIAGRHADGRESVRTCARCARKCAASSGSGGEHRSGCHCARGARSELCRSSCGSVDRERPIGHGDRACCTSRMGGRTSGLRRCVRVPEHSAPHRAVDGHYVLNRKVDKSSSSSSSQVKSRTKDQQRAALFSWPPHTVTPTACLWELVYYVLRTSGIGVSLPRVQHPLCSLLTYFTPIHSCFLLHAYETLNASIASILYECFSWAPKWSECERTIPH